MPESDTPATRETETGALWDHHAIQAAGLHLVVVTKTPQQLKKGTWPATEKHINGTIVKGKNGLLGRHRPAWWLQVQYLAYDRAAAVWKPYAGGKHANHVVVMDQLLWRLPSKQLLEFVQVRRLRKRGRGSTSPSRIASAELSTAGVQFAITYGNLAHYG